MVPDNPSSTMCEIEISYIDNKCQIGGTSLWTTVSAVIIQSNIISYWNSATVTEDERKSELELTKAFHCVG